MTMIHFRLLLMVALLAFTCVTATIIKQSDVLFGPGMELSDARGDFIRKVSNYSKCMDAIALTLSTAE